MAVITRHYFLLKTITTTLHYVEREDTLLYTAQCKKNKKLTRPDSLPVARLRRIKFNEQLERFSTDSLYE